MVIKMGKNNYQSYLSDECDVNEKKVKGSNKTSNADRVSVDYSIPGKKVRSTDRD